MSESMSKPMADIPIESVDRGFAKWIEKVEEDGGFLITRDGFPIVQLVRCGPRFKRGSPEWQKAREELAAIMKEGLPLGGLKIENRDDIYDR